MAHPYRLWDREADGPSPVTEIPLVFMDNALRGSQEAQWAQAYERLEAAAAVSGAVAALLHAGRFVEQEGSLQRYAGLLKWLTDRGAVLAADARCAP